MEKQLIDLVHVWLKEQQADLLTKVDIREPSQMKSDLAETEESNLDDDSTLVGNALVAEETIGDIDEDYDLSNDPSYSSFTGGDTSTGKDIFEDYPVYPTPSETPPAALLSATIQQPETDESQASDILNSEEPKYDDEKFRVWRYAFLAGQVHQSVGKIRDRPIDRARIFRLIRTGNLTKLHRRDLPEPPRRHSDLADHPMGSEFQKAQKEHFSL